jgi:hypothetical protein
MDDKKAQRYLLGGIEEFLEANPDMMSHAPQIIKTLYDLDICEKETILSWSSKASENVNKKLAALF